MSGDEAPRRPPRAEAPLWLARAREDVAAAELLLRDPDLILSSALHCQQAAEKLAKAVLIVLGTEYPRIHDIGKLGRFVGADHQEIREALSDLGGVTDWYITTRYPDEGYVTPSYADVEAALTKIKALYELVASLVAKT
jgi:HEPN domain-containing protein